ncbi:hypothetical protein OEG79_09540 [Pseudomonas sp. Z8(2022)]|uniref:hypothetical protein n=1 Tax=Pseudomonas sp. Z8(2022) TaxID=2962597 RepID=UPI0021F3E37D|nr:hypothetical protein [Pseudomonas sp. Z8(2022)]UYP32301.1 hypothetical protein OEG79_09540 [Pseudomonas sp. Z8(2022)]
MGNVLKADNLSEVLWRDARKPGEQRDLGVSVRQALGLQRLTPQAGKPVLGRREAILLGVYAAQAWKLVRLATVNTVIGCG